MATPNVGILTNAGKNLIDQVNAGQTKITFSKIVFSSMDNNQLTDDQIKALTTVAPQEIVVNNPKVTLDNNTGETRIRATGTNEALTDGVYVKTYAVYAKDDSGNESLYGLTVSPNPNYLPEYDGVTPQAVTYSYKVNISNTSNITFTNSDDIYVSDTDLAEALQPYAKTVDVNQQLDKKVNVSDMRKPASDVVGLEDIKSSILPNGTDLYTLINTSGQPLSYYASTYASAQTMVNKPITKLSAFKLTTASIGDTTSSNYNYTSLTLKDQSDGSIYEAFLTTNGSGAVSVARPWYKVADDSKVVHSTDMRKPASDVAGIEEVNAKADDSKVAHLSGANNFDTTPTVNNNPLLLASSLPSDLARTGSDQEFTGKNTFDTAPIDKTTGNPYITKDGVPSDVARTGQSNTFTAAQTFSIAPVINDASTSKGDNQAATMADLKSVENSAWHLLKTKDVGGDFDINMLYFKNYKSNYIRIIFLADSNVRSKTYSNYRIVVDMSKVITSFSESSGIVASLSLGSSMTGDVNGPEQGTANFVIATISGYLDEYEGVQVATNFISSGIVGDFRGIDFKVNGFI